MARRRLAPLFLLALALASEARADEHRGRELDAPVPAPPRPVSPYVQLSLGAGLQEDARHDEIHASVRTRVTGGITFPFGLRLGLSTWMQTFYDSASLSADDGTWERSTRSYGASGAYLAGLEIAYRPDWDPFAFGIGAHAGLGYGEIDVPDAEAFTVRDEGRFAVVAGGHVAAGVAIFGNFDLLLRVDLDYAVLGERSALFLAGSIALEWH